MANGKHGRPEATEWAEIARRHLDRTTHQQKQRRYRRRTKGNGNVDQTGRPSKARTILVVASVFAILASVATVGAINHGQDEQPERPVLVRATGSTASSIDTRPTPTPTNTPSPTWTRRPTTTPTPSPTATMSIPETLEPTQPRTVSKEEMYIAAFAECNGQFDEDEQRRRAQAARSTLERGYRTPDELEEIVQENCPGAYMQKVKEVVLGTFTLPP